MITGDDTLVRLLEEQTATLDCLPAGVAVLDKSGIVVSINRTWRDAAAAANAPLAESAIGHPYGRFVELVSAMDGNSARALDDGIRNVLSGAAATFEEIGRYSLCGKQRWYRLTVAPLTRGSSAAGAIIMVLDVTDTKLVEAELTAARLAAEEASRMKSQFLANTSHELRTPLNAIIGFSEIMVSELFGEMPDRYRGYVGDILQSGKLLLNLIGDLLDLSKIEAGRLELDESPVELAILLEECINLLADRAATGKISIQTAIPADLMVLADRLRLKQILLNLLTNAIKFTPLGGTVSVTGAVAPDHGISLAVADTGIGMSDEGIRLAVQPFVRLDGSVTRNVEGAGLGLALVMHLVSLHGGILDIQSAPGAGTTVTVRLPPERNCGAPSDAA